MPRQSDLQTHRGLIFNHEGDPRVGASITMVGVIAVLLGGIFMVIGPPLKTSSSLGRKTSGQPEPAAVRVVGATPREEVSCEQQTWPNIAQRCLVRSTAASSADRTLPAPDNAKLLPLTATGNVVAPAPAAVDGTAPNNLVTEQQAVSALMQSDAKVGYGTDELDESPPQRPAEPVRKRVHRHSGSPFKFPFRF